jgi:hypothetical protein
MSESPARERGAREPALAELQQEKDRLEAWVAEQREDIVSLRVQLESLRQSKCACESELRAQCERHRREQQLSAVESRRWCVQCQKALADEAASKARRRALRAEVAALTEGLRAYRLSKTERQQGGAETAAFLTAQAAKLKSANRLLREGVRGLREGRDPPPDARLAALQKTNGLLLRLIEEERAKSAGLSGQNEELRASERSYRQRIVALDRERQALAAETETVAQQCEALAEQNRTLGEPSSKLRGERASPRRGEPGRLEAENRRLRAKVAQLTALVRGDSGS